MVIIDGTLGFTGSLNLADPALFKKDAGVRSVGGRLRSVQRAGRGCPGRCIFLYDWELETGEAIHGGTGSRTEAAPGAAVVQVLPSGPGERVGAIEQVLLAAIYAANRELVLTTPYFVLDESLLAALLSAPGRGVDVTLIVPAKVDSRMTHYASRAYQADLLAAGVRIALYQGGLLHTKSLAVDGQFSPSFGSLNLDPRSSAAWTSRITLAVYKRRVPAAACDSCTRGIWRSPYALDLPTCHSPVLPPLSSLQPEDASAIALGPSPIKRCKEPTGCNTWACGFLPLIDR